ncbi:MAG: tRNA guanosine(34) transglycosylase Tgt [Alphaproteobacteria bacterium]|nr:tRNA guanosine(34) transglycosylase Tgt [Alphaproteobacteria bacterium]
MTLRFTIHATDGHARTGVLSTLHGDIRTPAFMPVGTAATVKAMHPEAVAATGADILLGNTYHLMLRPTAERIARLGGLHAFMNWDKPILTDSGGFQVMSLAHLRKMTEQAVTFQSHIDGSTHVLSPERSMEIQHLLGSTITMALDECTPFPATQDEARTSMEMSMRWAARSREAYDALKKDSVRDAGSRSPLAGESNRHVSDSVGGKEASLNPGTRTIPPTQSEDGLCSPARGERGIRGADGDTQSGYGLFGIVQGSIYAPLRLRSAEALAHIGFDGYAIGGLAVGEGQAEMFRVLDFTIPATPAEKPRYLMGVGKPADILGAVVRGVDMFDCVIPTRSGRNARAYTSRGEINLRNARHADDPRPLDEATNSPINRYSRAYLHHLFKADEMLGPMLLTQHNLHYYQELMAGLRAAIARGQLEAHAAALTEGWKRGDLAAI